MVLPTRWCSFLISVRMSTRSLASRLESGSSNRKSFGIAHQRAAHRDALALAAGELAGLAVEKRLDLQQRGDALDRGVLLGLRHAAALHAEGDVLRAPSSSGRARRTGTPWRCRGPSARTELTSRPSMRISPALTLSSPAIMASSVDLPQPDGPTSAMNSPVSRLEIDALQHLDRAEALVQAARRSASPCRSLT